MIKLPLCICHGNDDKITDCDMSKLFYERCGCDINDKILKIYNGRGHGP